MKKNLFILVALLLPAHLQAQVESEAVNWRTRFITSGQAYRIPPLSSYKEEIAQVLTKQQRPDSAGLQQILYWNAGAPGYRWQGVM